MTAKRLMKVANLAPHNYSKGSGYSWDNGGYAFDENFLDSSDRKDRNKKRAAERFKEKQKTKKAVKDTKIDLVLKHGKV